MREQVCSIVFCINIATFGFMLSHKGTKVTKDIENGVSFVTFVSLCEKKEKQGCGNVETR